jgi:hypothetical protein
MVRCYATLSHGRIRGMLKIAFFHVFSLLQTYELLTGQILFQPQPTVDLTADESLLLLQYAFTGEAASQGNPGSRTSILTAKVGGNIIFVPWTRCLITSFMQAVL